LVSKPVLDKAAEDSKSSRFMSGHSDLNIDYVAELARIALTADEKARFSKQLADVLAYIEKLNEVDVTGVEPMAHAFPVYNVWREDVPEPGLATADLEKMAPSVRNQMIVVPKVVEDAG
jgi:aspartyl-tRNA(Asn)/glutamyl-tRNA(Gln) amidotransferase subunit C